jgi:hypothetical protein
MWSVDWSTNLHAVANGGHGFSLKLEYLNSVNAWRPCITFRNFFQGSFFYGNTLKEICFKETIFKDVYLKELCFKMHVLMKLPIRQFPFSHFCIN